MNILIKVLIGFFRGGGLILLLYFFSFGFKISVVVRVEILFIRCMVFVFVMFIIFRVCRNLLEVYF